MTARRSLLALAVALIAAASVLPGPVAAQTAPPKVPDLLRSVSIIPPGQDGNLGVADLVLQQAGSPPEHYADQLEQYMGLVDDDDVTTNELLTHFHEQQFGPPEIVDEYHPAGRESATVYRDALGIPHVYGETTEDLAFALGYVTGEDRLFQADVYRHAGHGTLAEFVGPSYRESDKVTRLNGYTEAELEAMIAAWPKQFPERGLGRSMLAGINAYAEGINAYIEELATRPEDIPAEYAATGNTPQPWRPIDTAALVVLQLRVFGETAGQELRNAALYRELVGRHGTALGRRIFDDLRRRNDPSSYPSIQPEDGRWPSQRYAPVNPKAIAIPDEPEEVAGAAETQTAALNETLRRIGFPEMGSAASTALLVTAERSSSGHPLQIGAPQVGYSVPQFFMEIDAHGGAPAVRLDFRGAAVPGASTLAAVGRGIDYAWTLTTGESDAVDVRAELLCEPDGKKPTLDSKHYVFRGRCVPMQTREETISWNLPPSDLTSPDPEQPPEPPGSETIEIDRTRHGPVFVRDTVGGRPVAFVRQRLFWMRELESVAAFAMWNSPALTRSVRDFIRAGDRMTVSFNSFYADARDVGYAHIGELPVRAPGIDPRLPSWGTGAWEWRGAAPYSRNPRVINPKQGWLVNWNNKPSAGWDAGDDTQWGDVQRVRLLAANMRERLAGGAKIDRADLVDVVRDAATRDMDAVRLAPEMLSAVRSEFVFGATDAVRLRRAHDIVSAWHEAGAHRADRDHDGEDDNGPATTIFDAWYDQLVHRVFDDELGEDAYPLVGVPVSDRPEFNNGSSYLEDFGNYLANVLGRRPMARPYCDDLGTPAKEGCSRVIVAALRAALAELAEEQGTADMFEWTRQADTITFEEQGGGSVPDIPWQNRGTYNHVVEVLGRRP